MNRLCVILSVEGLRHLIQLSSAIRNLFYAIQVLAASTVIHCQRLEVKVAPFGIPPSIDIAVEQLCRHSQIVFGYLRFV